MLTNKYMLAPWQMNEDDDESKEQQKEQQVGPQMMKKMEKLFFEKRAVYLWGPVDDKSARDVVSKLLLLDADRLLDPVSGRQVTTRMAGVARRPCEAARKPDPFGRGLL